MLAMLTSLMADSSFCRFATSCSYLPERQLTPVRRPVDGGSLLSLFLLQPLHHSTPLLFPPHTHCMELNDLLSRERRLNSRGVSSKACTSLCASNSRLAIAHAPRRRCFVTRQRSFRRAPRAKLWALTYLHPRLHMHVHVSHQRSVLMHAALHVSCCMR